MATLDPDQARVLRVLRYWFGDLKVLAVLEGVRGRQPPLASQQLALTVDDQQRTTGRGSHGSGPCRVWQGRRA